MNNEISIIEASKLLIKLRGVEATDEQWSKAISDFSYALEQTNNADHIFLALQEDMMDDLPIKEKTSAFEKILELEYRTPKVLRMYADHLWFHGPASDDYVEQLREEADKLENPEKE